jgi:hypothetical protein
MTPISNKIAMNELHPQLASIEVELRDAIARAARLVESVDDGAFQNRPDPGRWSMAECLIHLNLTAQAYLPLIDAALASSLEGSASGTPPATHRYRRDMMGWVLSKTMEPPVRTRVKTAAAFIPSGGRSRGEILEEFTALHEQLIERLHRASGRDLGKMRVASPFNARITYNLYSAFRIIPAHDRRHLWQAEQVRDLLRGR